MKVKVMLMRKLGRNMPQKEQHDAPSVTGRLSLDEKRDPELGRTVMRAQLRSLLQEQGAELLPDLNDARVLWIDGSRMRLSGLERLENASYAQTWAVELM
jgi:hypothetical protein